MNQTSNNLSAAHTVGSAQVDAPAARLHPWSGRLLIMGGLLMVGMYVMEIVFGLQHGRMPSPEDLPTSWFVVAQGACFALSLILIGGGLGLLGRALRSRAPILATISLLFAALALVVMVVNLALVLGRSAPIGELGGLGVVSSLVASTLLGIAGLRTRAVSRPISLTLLTVGLITFPSILLTIPLEAVLPSYVVGDLPFPVWGMVFAVLGGLLLRQEAR
jgi:hypothetical protein